MKMVDQLEMTENTEILPFLKWAGGKRWFVQRHASLLPKEFNCYIEPFLGSGSVFFHLRPTKAILGDINTDVIAAYTGLQLNWQGVLKSLKYHQRKHSEEYYYKVREKQPKELVPCASRMIYLNRTCFNGIYRVNLQGEFNVPKGTKDRVIFNSDRFDEISRALSRAKIQRADFELLIDKAQQGDFIFADPPYTVRHNFNGFVKYNEKLFSWEDQERLAKALIRAKKRGVQIISTNANHSSIKALYEGAGFKLTKTIRYSSISGKAEFRKQFDELIISSVIKRATNDKLISTSK